jgi:hypothetical protein
MASAIANAYSIPEKIKVVKESGITVRQGIDSTSEKLTVVYHNYSYDVTDANIMYYKVKNKDGVEGWIYNNSEQNWVEEVDNNQMARINLVSGITMRSKPYDKTSGIVGLVEFMEFYKILDVIFSHFKIKTPDGKDGWIYAGRPNDSWVEADVLNVNEKNPNDIESEAKEKFDDGKLINRLDESNR